MLGQLKLSNAARKKSPNKVNTPIEYSMHEKSLEKFSTIDTIMDFFEVEAQQNRKHFRYQVSYIESSINRRVLKVSLPTSPNRVESNRLCLTLNSQGQFATIFSRILPIKDKTAIDRRPLGFV